MWDIHRATSIYRARIASGDNYIGLGIKLNKRIYVEYFVRVCAPTKRQKIDTCL